MEQRSPAGGGGGGGEGGRVAQAARAAAAAGNRDLGDAEAELEAADLHLHVPAAAAVADAEGDELRAADGTARAPVVEPLAVDRLDQAEDDLVADAAAALADADHQLGATGLERRQQARELGGVEAAV